MKRIIISSTIALATMVALTATADDVTPNSNDTIMLAAKTTNTTPSTTTTNTSFTPDQVKGIQQIVHDYLVQNPQVLVEASQALQAQEATKAEASAQQAIVQYKTQLFNDPASPVAGNANGTVTLVEFFDYQCIHCKAMNSTIQGLITKNPNLKVVFKELPIFGGNSQFAAQAALAAAKQGKYLTFHDALLAADNPITQEKVLSIAKKVGLNVNTLKTDMNSPEIQKQIQDNFNLAQSMKLMGTPTFVLSDKNMSQFKFIPGQTTQADLQQKISSLTSGAAPTSMADSATDTAAANSDATNSSSATPASDSTQS